MWYNRALGTPLHGTSGSHLISLYIFITGTTAYSNQHFQNCYNQWDDWWVYLVFSWQDTFSTVNSDSILCSFGDRALLVRQQEGIHPVRKAGCWFAGSEDLELCMSYSSSCHHHLLHLSFNKIQNGDILVPAYPCLTWNNSDSMFFC